MPRRPSSSSHDRSFLPLRCHLNLACHPRKRESSTRLVVAEHDVALQLYEEGSYQRALDKLQHALALYEESDLRNPQLQGNLLLATGVLHNALGDCPSAAEFYGGCIRCLEQAQGSEYIGLVSAYFNCGVLFVQQGKTTEALKILKKVSTISACHPSQPVLCPRS